MNSRCISWGFQYGFFLFRLKFLFFISFVPKLRTVIKIYTSSGDLLCFNEKKVRNVKPFKWFVSHQNNEFMDWNCDADNQTMTDS